MRFHEAQGGRVNTTLTPAFDALDVVETDLLERPLEAAILRPEAYP